MGVEILKISFQKFASLFNSFRLKYYEHPNINQFIDNQYSFEFYPQMLLSAFHIIMWITLMQFLVETMLIFIG